MNAVFLHLALTVGWMLLSQGRSLLDLIYGFFLGLLLLWLFRPVFDSSSYLRRVTAFFRFAGSFIYAFVTANVSMARLVLFTPVDQMKAAFIEYDIGGLKDFEIVLLSHAISLTPGTTSTEVNEDCNRLIVHCMDARHPDSIRRDIDHLLKNPMLAFTRRNGEVYQREPLAKETESSQKGGTA